MSLLMKMNGRLIWLVSLICEGFQLLRALEGIHTWYILATNEEAL